MEVVVRAASPADATALAALAAMTFPLACPPDAPQDEIAAFVGEHLTEPAFGRYLADPLRKLFVAQAVVTSGEGQLLAYSMLVDAPPSDLDVAMVVTETGAVELSKCYAHPDVHGHGISAKVMQASLDWISRDVSRASWLGVNAENRRALAFYRRLGFAVVGTRNFHLGNRVEHDFVMVRPKEN